MIRYILKKCNNIKQAIFGKGEAIEKNVNVLPHSDRTNMTGYIERILYNFITQSSTVIVSGENLMPTFTILRPSVAKDLA